MNVRTVSRALGRAFVRYHVGLGRMPWRWKPWLLTLLCANMIAPLFFVHRLEAQVVFAIALFNGATFVVLTAIAGFSRLLGLAHFSWIPLVIFLWLRLDAVPTDSVFGWWIRAVIVLNATSVLLDASNVVRFVWGDRDEMVDLTDMPRRITD